MFINFYLSTEVQTITRRLNTDHPPIKYLKKCQLTNYLRNVVVGSLLL